MMSGVSSKDNDPQLGTSSMNEARTYRCFQEVAIDSIISQHAISPLMPYIKRNPVVTSLENAFNFRRLPTPKVKFTRDVAIQTSEPEVQLVIITFPVVETQSPIKQPVIQFPVVDVQQFVEQPVSQVPVVETQSSVEAKRPIEAQPLVCRFQCIGNACACLRVFTTLKTLKQHIKASKDKSEAIWECKPCRKSFTRRVNYLTHVAAHLAKENV